MPHAAAQAGSFEVAARATMIGLLVTMLMVRWFHFHQHEVPGDSEHEHDCGDSHAVTHDHAPTDQCGQSPLTSRFGWVGVCVGLSIHAVMDGVALGASVAGFAHDVTLGFAGLGTFLAIALHKPLDALSITSLMTVSGFTGVSRLVVNIGYAVLCPAGALVCYFGVQGMGDGQSLVLGWTLGLSAGIFLCIALVDVLPEVQFHRHDRAALSMALLLGVLMAWGIGLVEPAHAHPHQTPAGVEKL
jgi:zinc and cadmium transporter